VSAASADAGCSTGTDGRATCHLWAKDGTVTLVTGGSPIPVWSFVGAAGDSITAPVGPTLVVKEGQGVDLVLHNQVVGQGVSISMPQIDGFPDDTTGVAAGGSTTYSFVAARPGTFLYEAGGTSDGNRQAAMGLVGALVVLPTTAGTAYGTPNTAYGDEGVIVLSDVDPGLNAAPLTYDMRNFSPRFHLFNGVAYPATPAIPVAAGSPALLRIVNAGIVQHGIGVLGTTQTVVAESARPLSHPYGVAAENVSAGDTMDLIVSVPSDPGLKYAVYDPSMRLDNDGAASSVATGNIVSFGGGLTFLQASGTAVTPNSPPVVSALSVSPSRVGGASPASLTFSATVTDDSQVQAVEYVLDNAGTAAGSGNPVTITPGPVVTLTAVPVNVSALGTGTHQLLVRGRDDANNWGALLSASFKVDRTGPTITGITPASLAVNGSGPLAFSGNASDVGGGSVASATWMLDNAGADPLTLSPATGANVALSGSVAAATIRALSEGTHYLSATAIDDLGNIGPAGPAGTPVGAAFTVDTTAPVVGAVTVTPSPNDGTQGISYDPTSIEVRATVSDTTATAGATPSGVTGGEGFIGTAGANGTGFTMVTNTTGGTLALVGTIPLSQLTSLSDGPTSIWVRGKDKAGNWGTAVAGTIVMNRAKPTASITGLTLTPATTSSAATTALAGTAAAQTGTTVSSGEYFIDTDPGVGRGVAVTVATPGGPTSALSATIPISGLTLGSHTVGVRVRTANGAWGPVANATLTLSALFSDGFEAGPLGTVTTGNAAPWASLSTTGLGTATRSTASALTGSNGLAISVSATGNRAYVSTPATTAVTPYHVAFQLNPNTLVTGSRWVSVFQALGSGGAERFRVEYQRNGAGTPQVRLVMATAAGPVTTAAVNLNASPPNPSGTNTIRVDWTAAASASVTFTVNANAPITTTALATNGRTVASGRLGISLAPTSGSGTYGGVINLDAFTSAYYGF
jgi:hypothetical protein